MHYNSFFSPDEAAFPAPATGTACFWRDAATNPMIAVTVSKMSVSMPVHAHCHTTMLTLPIGALGNEANHST